MATLDTIHRPLAPGARVQLIAPASPFDVAAFEQGVIRLRRRYEVDFDPEITTRRGFFAGDDARRLRELRAALASKRVDAIIAARGGHGCTRIAPLLSIAEIRRHAPLLVGFSDVTALHAIWAHARVASLHASMVASLGRVDDALFERFCAALEDRYAPRVTELTPLATGTAEGTLLGGNLAVLAALLGTPLFPPLTDSVLFLEDVGERPYRVDRMLTSLRNAGVLEGVRGIVLGAFVQGDPGADGVTLVDVLRERLSDLGVPVVMGCPAGHIDDNLELPLGRRVTLDATGGVLHLHERSQA